MEGFMTLARHCFLAGFIAVLFLGVSFAESPDPLEKDNPVLLNHSMPAGVRRVGVIIVSSSALPPSLNLAQVVTDKLTKAGIEVFSKDKCALADVPELRVYLDILELSEPNRTVFAARTAFATKVSPANDPDRFIKADTWTTPVIMKQVPQSELSVQVSDSVLQQVDAFVAVCLSADAKTTPTSKPDSPYIASKKSKVFHKADCGMLRSIKPENIVHYQTRGEAIKAGKRPCKRCKP